MPADPAGRRERKKHATRHLIRMAALQLALERGLEHVTVQAIADQADVATRTFFGYFPTKEAALAPDQPWTGPRLAETFAARPAAESAIGSLRAVMLAMAVQVTGDSDKLRLWRELARRYPHLVEHFLGSEQDRVEALADAVAARLGLDPRLDVYPSAAAWLAWTAGGLAVRRWLQAVAANPTETPPPIEPCVDAVFDALERGLTR
jgi:AcrR family transcriptional regulator